MRVLILGGTRFVGRAIAADSVARGWPVTVFHRGVTGAPPDGAESLLGDRTTRRGLAVLAGREWDVAIDTWEGPPAAVADSANLLRDAAGRYVYLSSRSVYRPPLPLWLTEEAPLVDGRADGDYGELKAGGERAARAAFGERALLVRAGLVLGPHETPGRLVWWLRRMALGGDVLAPGPTDLPLQYIDVRDLARWVLDAARDGRAGAYNAVSPPGHTTMDGLLLACRQVTGTSARLRWVAPVDLLAAGVRPWSQLPVWVPPGHPLSAFHRTNVDKAVAAGLRCRAVGQTVADTWTWLRGVARDDDESLGLDPATEAAILRNS